LLVGRPFVKPFALCYRTVVVSVLSVCDVGVLWPNGSMDQDETWRAGRPRPWPHCVRCGPSSPSHKGAQLPPRFLAHICCGQMSGWIKMELGVEVGLCPGDFVLDGDPASPSPKTGWTLSPIFGPCPLWPTAGWIKTALGTEVRLGPGHIVLDGDPAPTPTKGHSSSQCSAHICCGQMAGWIKMPLGMEIGLGPGDFVLDGDPASPPPKGG